MKSFFLNVVVYRRILRARLVGMNSVTKEVGRVDLDFGGSLGSTRRKIDPSESLVCSGAEEGRWRMKHKEHEHGGYVGDTILDLNRDDYTGYLGGDLNTFNFFCDV